MRNYGFDLLETDLTVEENERYRSKLSQLRQTIMEVDPSVMLDGRFEEMINTPATIIDVARALLQARRLTPH